MNDPCCFREICLTMDKNSEIGSKAQGMLTNLLEDYRHSEKNSDSYKKIDNARKKGWYYSLTSSFKDMCVYHGGNGGNINPSHLNYWLYERRQQAKALARNLDTFARYENDLFEELVSKDIKDGAYDRAVGVLSNLLSSETKEKIDGCKVKVEQSYQSAKILTVEGTIQVTDNNAYAPAAKTASPSASATQSKKEDTTATPPRSRNNSLTTFQPPPDEKTSSSTNAGAGSAAKATDIEMKNLGPSSGRKRSSSS